MKTKLTEYLEQLPNSIKNQDNIKPELKEFSEEEFTEILNIIEKIDGNLLNKLKKD